LIERLIDAGYRGGTQLCFDRADFTRDTFNVDKLVNVARRHASTEQLQASARMEDNFTKMFIKTNFNFQLSKLN